MDSSTAIGLSRQITLARALEVSANNLANQTTMGFKAQNPLFVEFLLETDHFNVGSDSKASFVTDHRVSTDFSQGALTRTLADFDFAISGDGFFAVETPDGIRLTRDGHFSLAPDGFLITRDGFRVLDQGQSPLALDPERGLLTVGADGSLQQDGQTVGVLGVFGVEDTAALTRTGQNLFAPAGTVQPVSSVTIRHGYLEQGNVVPITAMTDLIAISRAYSQAAQLIETRSDLTRNAINQFTETS